MKCLLLGLALLTAWGGVATSASAGHHHHHHYARPQGFYSMGYRPSYGYGGYGYRGYAPGCGPVSYAVPYTIIGYVRVPVVSRAPAAYRSGTAYRGVSSAYRGIPSSLYRARPYGNSGY